jgi:glycosyltransferase involved in cell wall biosynthesis
MRQDMDAHEVSDRRIDVLLASGTPHLPQLTGGLEVNTHELSLELNARRISTAVLAKLSLRDGFGIRAFLFAQLRHNSVARDTELGYDVFRSRKPWRNLRGMPLPAVVVIQNGRMVDIATRFQSRGVPAVAYFHGLDFENNHRPWPQRAELPFRAYIANSAFTAERVERRLGVRPVIIPPIFKPERYRVTSSGRFVTFINPVPEKGVQQALAIAAQCPDIPFLFVKAWPLTSKAARQLARAAERLSNVTIVDRSSDMRTIYRDTKILLVPSQWEETWGRVATEAHFSGIPVLASSSGALRESVGKGGVLIDRTAPAEFWAGELRRIWDNDELYAELSLAASGHSRRAQIAASRQIDMLLSVLDSVRSERFAPC